MDDIQLPPLPIGILFDRDFAQEYARDAVLADRERRAATMTPEQERAAFEVPVVSAEPVAWRQFLTDVITASGLLSHGKTDKRLAKRIADYAFDAMTHPPAPAVAWQPLCVTTQAQIDAMRNDYTRSVTGRDPRFCIVPSSDDVPLYLHPPAPAVADKLADRLAVALRDALEDGCAGDWQSARQGIVAALAEYDRQRGDTP